MTVGSLFSGIGGFDLGFERAGFEVRWQVEIDSFCRAVLAKHWPDVRRYEDVTRVGEELERVDAICAGFPCQPFSSSSRGRARGTADDRWLWPEVSRVVSLLGPAWVICENVPGLDGVALEQVAIDLESLGYQVGTLEIPACAVGCDHWRPRLWILGHTNRHSQSGRAFDEQMARMQGAVDDAERMGTTYGVSGRLDRYRMAALGNAIVPQVAEIIARYVLAVDALEG